MDMQEGRRAVQEAVGPWQAERVRAWGCGAEGEGPERVVVPARHGRQHRGEPPAEVYLAVRRGAAFQEVRRRYRRFVAPATAGFLLWYLAYVMTATLAPGLMAHRVAGALNVAMLTGLGQFATTFLLTWAYARHARLRRDRAALDIRWEAQELMGGHVR
ncbi:DUF485 domain-containing protein [Streptomyces sp. NPDC003077]|uniref:DUF485 domain-containing protein n=1 Tax=Streptomyces sp. NPDC003077 TaxID=3154443 RepID=UPI0033A80563